MTRGEVWFDEEPDNSRVDWIYYIQRPAPVPKSRWKQFDTRLIELQKSPEDLLAQMEVKTARKIADAQENDKLRCQPCDPRNSELMDQVELMWNAFAIAQKTPLLDRPWLNRFIEAGVLDVTAAMDPAGNLLAYHLVYVTPKRARQLIAISPYKAVPTVAWRNAVSRANCLIHWNRFLSYRERGIQCFDFGGWYSGNSDIRLLGINAFKKSFGGKLVREYDCERPVTVKGWVLLNASRILNRLRQSRMLNRGEPENKSDETQPDEHKVSPAFR